MPGWLLAACLCGMAVSGAGIALWLCLTPTTPDLVETLTRLHSRPEALSRAAVTDVATPTWQERLGGWVQRRTTTVPGLRTPYQDLDLLGMSAAHFHAHKALWAVAGMAAPTFLVGWSALLGLTLGWGTPVILAIMLAVAGWCLPHLWVRRRAATTRQRFSRTITAYIDLVVLERLSGATLATSIIEPAMVAEAPLFVRIRQTVNRHQLERKPPWSALRELADSLELPDLRELADTMELSGLKGAPMADQLKARAGDIRNAWLHHDVEAAGAASQRQVAATGLLLLCFLVFVGAPALLRLVG